MSRGLGTGQHLALKALASLEAEHGESDRFYVWAIVDRIYALSPEMQNRQREEMAAVEARHASIKTRAAQGDDKARLYLSLTRGMVRCRPSLRKRRESPFRQTETRLNPSRVLASLERRGFVVREPVNGGGTAGLTEEGRQLVTQLSVGSSVPLVTSDSPLNG